MKDFLCYMHSLGVSSDDCLESKLLLPTMQLSESDKIRPPQEISSYVYSNKLLSHPFLLDFHNNKISGFVLQTWVKQRYLISWCFPNWLTAVISKITSIESRIPLIKNLYDEHGLGKDYHKPHPQMWQQLFEEFKITTSGSNLPLPTSINEITLGTQLYLNYYTKACFDLTANIGVGIMAFTEMILPYENLMILEGLRSQKVSEQGREFFEAHSYCDKQHSEEILNVIISICDDPKMLEQVWQGVRIGELARVAFYDSLSLIQEKNC